LGIIVCAFLEYSLIDFFSMYLHVTRRFNPDTYLNTFDALNCNDYIITNDKFLSNPSRQNKHRKFPLVSATSCARLLNRIKPLRHHVKRKKASQGAFPGQPFDYPDTVLRGHMTSYQAVLTSHRIFRPFQHSAFSSAPKFAQSRVDALNFGSWPLSQMGGLFLADFR